LTAEYTLSNDLSNNIYFYKYITHLPTYYLSLTPQSNFNKAIRFSYIILSLLIFSLYKRVTRFERAAFTLKFIDLFLI
jgi:hypothetical protein